MTHRNDEYPRIKLYKIEPPLGAGKSFRVYWESLIKDRRGSGSKGYSKDEAEVQVNEPNISDSNFAKYWIQEEGSDTDGKLYENGVEVYE